MKVHSAKQLARIAVISAVIAAAQVAAALNVTRQELLRAHRWAEARFQGEIVSPATFPALVVSANHGPVLKNARAGKPLRIANEPYTNGLLCHAFSKITVRLPLPGDRFTAVVGVDSNEQTAGGRGSVDFSVSVGEAEKFRSGIMREGMAGKLVNVDLDSTNEFVIQVDPTPDGIACDHADWVDAKVKFTDGSELWLSELQFKMECDSDLFSTTPPFSFTYDGKPFAQLLESWTLKRASRPLDNRRTEHTLTWADPKTALVLRCVAVEYHDFPTVEWTLYFKNTGNADTPILSDIRALDVRLARNAESEFVLHHNLGSPCQPNDYQPLVTTLRAKSAKRITAAGGRPTNSDLSYFNVQWREAGMIAVIGWPGQWAAEFSCDEEARLRVSAGQETAHFRLHPGEEVRSPLVVLQFYQGDWLRAQNIWRRWMVAYNLPRPGGQLVPTHYASCFGNMQPRADEEIAIINGFLREKIKFDFWIIDAGWYPGRGSWVNTGTWEVDRQRFPHGLREVADFAHSNGMKFIVWFEPERVTAGSWLAENHPEWVLGGKSGGLLNLGNPEAWKWVVDHFENLLTTQRIDAYRQDFNIDPLSYWKANDTEDRQGITEIKHVTGYLAYWDELLRRHPNLWIDTCASGGRRNDLETLRRSVPLLRSDYWNDATAQQCHTYGISLWMPYYGSGLDKSDAYWFRSCIFPASRVGWDTRKQDLDYPLLRQMLGEYRKVEPYLLGDFYPLTPYSLENTAWMAWQFDRPETGEGMVQVFRREQCIYEAARLPLHGLDANAHYAVTNLDDATKQELTGRELMEQGLRVTLTEKPAAAIFIYKCAPARPSNKH